MYHAVIVQSCVYGPLGHAADLIHHKDRRFPCNFDDGLNIGGILVIRVKEPCSDCDIAKYIEDFYEIIR